MRVFHFSLLIIGVILLISGCTNTENDDKTKDGEVNNNTDTSENTSANTEMDGTLWEGDGDVGVILSHGAAYDADSWEEQGQALADNGMVAFATEDTSPEELIAAANMLQDDYDVDEVALLGASAGGGSAIEAATDGGFDFLKSVLLSPVSDATAIKDMPVLVIYSEDEGYEDLEEAISEEPDANIETLAIPGSAHAQEMFDAEDGDDVLQDIIDFLKK